MALRPFFLLLIANTVFAMPEVLNRCNSFDTGVLSVKWRQEVRALLGRTDGTFLNERPTEYGSRTGPLLPALTEAAEVPAIVIVTHQRDSLEASTVAALQSPAFRSVPRLLLSNTIYPIGNRQLAQEGTLIQYSPSGQLDVNMNTPLVHLMGGYCQACLSTSARHIIFELFNRRNRRTLELRLHGSLAYSERRSIREELDALPPEARLARARQLVARMVDNPGAPPDFSEISSETTPSGYRFRFRRNDQRVLTISIDNSI